MTNKNNTVLHTGSSDNLIKRVYQHKNKFVDGFTKLYNINKLVYYEFLLDALNMVKRERTVKNLVRRKKVALIESMNPEWKDLYEELI